MGAHAPSADREATAEARRPVLIAGPTAVGKSAVALALAERLNGEIVSVDSMQVYRGLDVGSAKPSALDRRRVTHHLIDVVEINERFDAAQFTRLARSSVNDIRQRGRVPILCGGTGLYFKAFLGYYGVIVVLAVAGFVAAYRRPALRPELALVLIYFVSLSIVHAVMFVEMRHRWAAEPLMLAFVPIGARSLWTRWSR